MFWAIFWATFPQSHLVTLARKKVGKGKHFETWGIAVVISLTRTRAVGVAEEACNTRATKKIWRKYQKDFGEKYQIFFWKKYQNGPNIIQPELYIVISKKSPSFTNNEYLT
jgi:hypothetical protein